jgi:hypothetical protein
MNLKRRNQGTDFVSYPTRQMFVFGEQKCIFFVLLSISLVPVNNSLHEDRNSVELRCLLIDIFWIFNFVKMLSIV